MIFRRCAAEAQTIRLRFSLCARTQKGPAAYAAGPSACRKSLFSPLSKFSELYKSSENLGFQWRRTPFLGFPRTPFLTVAENLPLYRQSPYIASAQKKCRSRRPRFRFFAYPNAASGWGRTEHFPRIYFARNWKTSHSFFCCSFYKR